MSRQHVEIIDGRGYTVTRLPQDRRLMPSHARKRALWDGLSPAQKAAEILTVCSRRRAYLRDL